MNAWWSAVIALGMAGAAAADDDPALPKTLSDGERRMRQLEERVNALEARRQETDESPRLREQAEPDKKAGAGQTWDAGKMLSFSTPDGTFTAKIGGRVYANFRHIVDREDSTLPAVAATGQSARSGGAADTFWIDSARFQLEGSFYRDFIYRVEGEGKSGDTAGSFRLKDVFVGWVLNDRLAIRAGQMKVPFSQEETTSGHWVDFAERSIMNRWIPAHDAGVLLSGSFADKVFEWALGGMNMQVNRDQNRGAVDVQDEKMLAARLFVSPFRTQTGALKTLRLGVDALHGQVDHQAQGDISTGDLGGVVMTDFLAPAILDGDRTGLLANFQWAYGPIGFRAEYGTITQELADGLAEDEYEVTMWQAQATWLVTGEEKVLENRITPADNFKPLEGGWGAVELAVRVSAYEVGDEVQDVGLAAAAATATDNANLEAREITLGLNWWWSPNVVWRFNYARLSFDEDLPNLRSGNEADDAQDVFIVRWQVDF